MPYKDKESAKAWTSANRDKVNKSQREYVLRNREKIRANTLKRNYGISLAEYNDLFLRQEGCCAICKQHQTSFKRQLFVDHCHTTGSIRGLLCTHCNLILGQAKDSVVVLLAAAQYLTREEV